MLQKQPAENIELKGANLQVKSENQFDLAAVIVDELAKRYYDSPAERESGILRIDAGGEEVQLRFPTVAECAANIELRCLDELPYGKLKLEVTLLLKQVEDEEAIDSLKFNMTTWRRDLYKLDDLDQAMRDSSPGSAPRSALLHLPCHSVAIPFGAGIPASNLKKALEMVEGLEGQVVGFRNTNNGFVKLQIYLPEEREAELKELVGEKRKWRYEYKSKEYFPVASSEQTLGIYMHEKTYDKLKLLLPTIGQIQGHKKIDDESGYTVFKLHAGMEVFRQLMDFEHVRSKDYFDRRTPDYYEPLK